MLRIRATIEDNNLGFRTGSSRIQLLQVVAGFQPAGDRNRVR
jgi:hypothetical protein